MPRHKVLVDISQRILRRFQDREIEVNEDFIAFAVHLLARDTRIGFVKYDLNKLTACTVNNFVENIVNGFTDLKHTTMANVKMAWLMKTSKEINIDYVKQIYEEHFQRQLQLLIHDILQYPETCSKLQLDQLFAKMQVFIVVCYNLGCPKNHVLLKLTAQALNSVIGRSDLQNYVLKKKYHRLEYLQRLAATVGGIIIFNNDGPDGDRENVRYVVTDLEMAQRNTQAAFDATLQRVSNIRKSCQSTISAQLEIKAKEAIIIYKCPLEKLQWLNQYTLTFSLLERYLQVVQASFHKTVYLVEVEQQRYDCVMAKINETLAMRTAIESELIFPHFVYLAKVWGTLNHYLNHIVELNKLREKLDSLVSAELDEHAQETINEITALGQRQQYPQERTFFERMDQVKDLRTDGNFSELANSDIKEFCALSLTITNGLLLPAHIIRKLCLNLDIKFGFYEGSYARICENWFEQFIASFRNVIFTNANLALLFNLGDAMIAKELQAEEVEPPKQQDFNGQTEMVVTNDLSVPNWINVTWNVWDYHRETIHMAEIRKRQTNDTQTKISFGRRNAQNQTYNTRQHFH